MDILSISGLWLQPQFASLAAAIAAAQTGFVGGVMPAQGAQEQAEVNKLQMTLNTAGDQLRNISRDLDQSVVQCGKATLDKLELAMAKVYKLAVFIRGAYDDRNPDTLQRDDLLNLMVNAFQDMEDCAEAGLKVISYRHAIVMEVQNTKILPAQADVHMLLQKTELELQNTQDQIRTSQASVDTISRSAQSQAEAVSRLQDKISDTEIAKGFSDVGFTILTLGIGNAINGGPLDPANLQGQLNDARRARDEAQNQLNEARMKLYGLQNERNAQDMRLRFVQQTEALVPTLSLLAETTENECITLQRRFAPLKDSASRFLVRVREIQEGAIVTKALAYSKKDFALGLLEISQDALLDQALGDEVRMVRDEIANEYGKKIPEDVEQALAGIYENIGTFATLPSLRG
ncbi:hypothetical protein JX265_006460 [Neoarthrinium moseri]|uniref:Uncharacterized protein n=1 Tax=Neoarthrinium moseri TaxID=1658444 RepID=A0A9P9WLI6_9PEZI|nr:hypothetical protein JX265_006460 [Neoarthrinium moseri]